MTITLFSQWSGTNEALNTDLNDTPLTENQMYPRHVNNSFREMMKQLKAALGTLSSAFTAASASGAASLDFHEDTDNGTNRVRLQGAASTADVTLTLPAETATIQTRVASTTDHAIVRFDSTAGVQQNSTVIVDDSGNISAVGTLDATNSITVNFASSNSFIGLRESEDANPPGITFRKGRVGPTAVDASDQLFSLNGQGYDGTSYNSTATGYIRMFATEDYTTSARGSRLTIATTTTGTVTRVDRLSIGPGVQVGAPTGGDKGAGTLNANAVYDDNTLLTCYPFDAYLDGRIDDAKWDALVPDRTIPAVVDDDGKVLEPARIERRTHEDMRKFRSRLGTEFDPLDIDKYSAHWKTKRHLTSLPNEATFDPLKGMPTGAWIQRLIETVEIQAIHISQLHDRLKAVEAARSR